MKILTQDRRTLIDTSEIFLNDIDKVMAISMYNSSEIIQIAKYKDFSYQTDRPSNNRLGYEMVTINVTSQNVCEDVMKGICRFFEEHPNGIYFMPTQEQAEYGFKGE